ncbi:DUF998 domain-containing protein [Thalassotalea euphylliae]|uniref:DUF998 domain-containing protein n=1 Tax=Thalassotalea euphylliae TaxID=1655234 RepID=A0A3E0TZZ8_9GAMM|nr:DUF998 domain-containing protein [Thalassotalea euphylliae]REL30044.1 DUF998 domain-containing protein [Thalassotalea euphylliae]
METNFINVLEVISGLSGLIATIWITIGVYIAAKFYPNYNHSNQFCSELGAAGSPTEKLSPLINNYPLGAIFCVFGWYVQARAGADIAIQSTGYLIIIHGLGTWVAGYFPMDKDPYTKEPTHSCKVHSWAGFIMLLSLLIAPMLVAFSGDNLALPTWFRIASVLTVILAIYYLVKMAQSVKQSQAQKGTGIASKVGLYQRISYWIKLIWLSAFSVILVQS